MSDATDHSLAVTATTADPRTPPVNAQGFMTLTDSEVEEIFRPLVIGDHASYNGWMLETYGADLERVQAADPACVWTVLAGDFPICLASGFHHVNREGYVITEVPVPEGMTYEVPGEESADEEDGDEEEDDMDGDDDDAPRGACILTAENIATEDDCATHDHEPA